jgi:hypothetical protein
VALPIQSNDLSSSASRETPRKNLATLRTDAPLFEDSATLRWRGATPAFAAWAKRMEAPRLLERCGRIQK